MELNKNELQTFYIQVEWKVLATQVKLIPSLIIFKRDIKRVICRKDKQLEHPIHKITIIECPTCEKMVEKNKNHYYSPARKMDSTLLIDIL